MRAISSCCRCAEGVVDGIEHGHSAGGQREDAEQGEGNIDSAYPADCDGDARMHLVVHGSCGFCGKELDFSYAEGWQYGYGKEYNSYTAYPLGEASPEEDAARHGVQIVYDGCACAGKS